MDDDIRCKICYKTAGKTCGHTHHIIHVRDRKSHNTGAQSTTWVV